MPNDEHPLSFSLRPLHENYFVEESRGEPIVGAVPLDCEVVFNGVKSFLALRFVGRGRLYIQLVVCSNRHTNAVPIVNLCMSPRTATNTAVVLTRVPIHEDPTHGFFTHGINAVRRIKLDNALVIREINPEEATWSVEKE